MRLVVRDKRLYIAYLVLDTVCSGNKYLREALRRWGNGASKFKAGKLAVILRREDPVLYETALQFFEVADARELGKLVWAIVKAKLKSIGVETNKFETVGDLCREIPRLKQAVFSVRP